MLVESFPMNNWPILQQRLLESFLAIFKKKRKESIVTLKVVLSTSPYQRRDTKSSCQHLRYVLNSSVKKCLTKEALLKHSFQINLVLTVHHFNPVLKIMQRGTHFLQSPQSTSECSRNTCYVFGNRHNFLTVSLLYRLILLLLCYHCQHHTTSSDTFSTDK